jgi:cysteine desulfuration protein SufE
MAITAVALNGLSATEVADFSLDFVQEMGLDTALTPSRANGFLNMFTKVRQIASTLAE